MKVISAKQKQRISLQKNSSKKNTNKRFLARRKMISIGNTELLVEKKKSRNMWVNIED